MSYVVLLHWNKDYNEPNGKKTVARQKFAVQAAAAAAAAVSTFEMNSSKIEAHSLKMSLTILSFFNYYYSFKTFIISSANYEIIN